MPNVSKINGYDLKDKFAREKIAKTPLSDFIDMKVFAQIIGEKVGFDMTNFGVQGFAIGNDVLCVGITTSASGTGDNSKLIAYNISTGEVIAYKDNVSIGHVNGMSYCDKDKYFYIACAGGQNGFNKVVAYDSSLNLKKTINFDGKTVSSPYGIAWDNKKQLFYCVVGGGLIAQFDYNFNLKKTVSMKVQTDSDYTGQSIFIAGDYLIFITNDLNHADGGYNKLDVYHLDTLEYYKKLFVMIQLELESCCYYNGECYFLFNSQNSGLLCKGDLFSTVDIGEYIPRFMFGSSRIATTGQYDTYYADSNYDGFFVDNTESKPFNRLLTLMGYIINNSYMERINILLKGDFPTKPINIKHLSVPITIRGQGTEKTKLGGVFIQNTPAVTMSGIEIVQPVSGESFLLGLKSVNYAWIENIYFNCVDTLTDVFWTVATNSQIKKCVFNTNVTRDIIHCVEGSSCIIGGGSSNKNTYNIMGKLEGGKDIILPYQTPFEFVERDISNNVTVFGATSNFDITKVRRTGIYRIEGGTTSINVPDDLKSGSYTFTVENRGGSVIEYRAIKYNGAVWRGIYLVDNKKIHWFCDSHFVLKMVNTEHSTGDIYLRTMDFKTGIIAGGLGIPNDIPMNTIVGTFNDNRFKPSITTYLHAMNYKGESICLKLTTNNELISTNDISGSNSARHINSNVVFSDIIFDVE